MYDLFYRHSSDVPSIVLWIPDSLGEGLGTSDTLGTVELERRHLFFSGLAVSASTRRQFLPSHIVDVSLPDRRRVAKKTARCEQI
jgi:hypothetical protein